MISSDGAHEWRAWTPIVVGGLALASLLLAPGTTRADEAPASPADPGPEATAQRDTAEAPTDDEAPAANEAPAADTEKQRAWSDFLPWGRAEAEARGFVLPRAFGVSVNGVWQKQPFDVTSLRFGSPGGPLEPANERIRLETIDTRQAVGTARIDAWLLPFLNAYALLGYTDGNMTGEILLDLPAPINETLAIPLDIDYGGFTYGGGATLAGGLPIAEWRKLLLITVADLNYTVVDLDFKDDALRSLTKVESLTIAGRAGLRGRLSKRMNLAVWAGTMYMAVS